MDAILSVWARKGQIFHFTGYPALPDDPASSYFIVAPFRHAPQHIRIYKGSIQKGFPSQDNIQPLFEKSLRREIPVKETSALDFKSGVNLAMEQIRAGKLSKVVLSAIKVVRESLSFSRLMNAFDALRHQHPDDFVCLLQSSEHGVWLGASPELLLAYEDKTVFSVALAGTRPVSEDHEAEIPWPDKEKAEQEFVTRYIEKILVDKGVKGLRIHGPFTRKTNTLEHLCTEFSGYYSRVTPADIIQLALDLHPTPAVGGVAPEAACALTEKLEKHDRSLYTGFWGFLTPSQGALFVNIRCFQAGAESVILYAGAGITAQSRPEEEWIEVRRKMRTAASALKPVEAHGQ
jgi:isochorismate synthase